MIVSAHAAHATGIPKETQEQTKTGHAAIDRQATLPTLPTLRTQPSRPLISLRYIKKKSKNAEQLPRIMTGSASLGYAACK